MINHRAARWLMISALAAVMALTTQAAQAHPHAYIDVKIEAQYDANGALIALNQYWTFDPAYTAFALFDLRDASAAEKQAKLDEIMAQNLKELADFNYFTEVIQNDAVISTGQATDAETNLNNGQIEMRFSLPVTGQADDKTPVTYAVFDPTYYIQMRHDLSADAVAVAHPIKNCQHQLVEPSPTTEQIMFAANLGRNATAPQGLGRLFMETVTITCVDR